MKKKKDIRRAWTKKHSLLPFEYEKRGNKKTCICYWRMYLKDKAENERREQMEQRRQSRSDTTRYPVRCSFDFRNHINVPHIKMFKSNEQGRDGGKIPQKQKWIKTNESEWLSNETITILKEKDKSNSRSLWTLYSLILSVLGRTRVREELQIKRWILSKRFVGFFCRDMDETVLKLFQMYYRNWQMSKCINVVGS